MGNNHNAQNNQIAVQEPKKLTASERFTNKVLAEFGSSVGQIALTEFQKRLAQNYFISIDSVIKAAEEKRLAKNERMSNDKFRELVPVTWEYVNMESLARNVVAYARIGLDPAQKNHINMIPYKNNSTKKYDIGFIEGYRGLELKAIKYGLDVPDAVIVELVYSNDKFKPIKKSMNNPYENYDFEIVDPFDRGEIKGGFYYHIYSKAPEKNKLVILSLKDIEKRKPKYASVEFWGGEKDEYGSDGKKTGKKEKVEGWYDKMCLKTISRAAYNDITIDSQKIDDDYLRVKQAETEFSEGAVEDTIQTNANKETLDFSGAVDADYTEPDQVHSELSEENTSGSAGHTGGEGPGY